MKLFAAATQSEANPMEENLNNLLHALFGVFENLSDMGDTWGDPWGWLFPTLVALGTALAFVAGIRYVFDLSQDKIKPLFVLALAIVAFLAFGAIFGDGNQDAASTEQQPSTGDN